MSDVLYVVAFFCGVVLVNGVLAILLIEVFRSLGLWAPETAEEAAVDLAARIRLRAGQTT